MKVLIILSVVLNIVFLLSFIFYKKRCKFDKFVEKEKRITSDALNAQITNQGLFDIWMTEKKDWRNWNDERAVLDDILKIARKCKEYLVPLKSELSRIGFRQNVINDKNLSRSLTVRQINCGIATNELIIRHEYINAINEFIDCIYDYGNAGRELRPVSMNECALYLCSLEQFLVVDKIKNDRRREETTYGEI